MTTWIVLRAAGIGAYLMLWASVTWGLIATTSLFGKRIAKQTATTVHQFLSTVGLVLLGVHLGGLLLDTFMPFRPIDLLVPLHGRFKPVSVAFGIAAMYAMAVVVSTSWIRKRLGTTWWRRIHLLAVPAFILALVHGVFTGTDSVRPWMWWSYLATGAVVLFLVLVRGLTSGYRPPRASPPPHARPRPTTRAAAGTTASGKAPTAHPAPASRVPARAAAADDPPPAVAARGRARPEVN